ncbi:MAG: hypothetical protein OXC10_14610 [Rhodospirillaceae bacterium]|nr:hypothetical protein [Rhodospirillaceae bacterium]
MQRREFLSAAIPAAPLFLGAIAIGPLSWAPAFAAGRDYRLSGPHTHRNLAIYLIHRDGGNGGPVPLTLSEALEQGRIKVFETGDVGRLVVRNLGRRDVFIQAGDIVKGGKQDRVLTISMIVPPKSGLLPVDAFCVERDRWARRGAERATEFSSSTHRLPSTAMKSAMMARTAGEGASGSGGQEEVWASVRRTQQRLSVTMERKVADGRSPTSIQLTLENRTLAAALAGYEESLGNLLEKHPHAVGYIFAIDGRIDSGDEFGTTGLFRKLWPRQLKAAATEALAEAGAGQSGEPPAPAQVGTILDGIRAATPVRRPVQGGMRVETRASEKMLFVETARRDGSWVHRSFIAHE